VRARNSTPKCRRPGIDKRTNDNLRHTDAAALSVVRRVMRRENLRLVDALHAEGVRASSILGGVFECDLLDPQRHGFVGKVLRVEPEGIQAATRAGAIPIIASAGETTDGQIVNLNADLGRQCARTGAAPRQDRVPHRQRRTAGRQRSDHRLDQPQQRVRGTLAQPWLHSGMRLKLEEIHALLSTLPPSSSVSITRPSELARELLRTVVRERWCAVARRSFAPRVGTSWTSSRLRGLIESAFGRKADPRLLRNHAAASRLRHRALPCAAWC
jgi:acetylglutamate kinase